MPGGDGLEILPRICKADTNVRMVPVMVLSADTTAQTRDLAFAAGARCVLAKPVDPKRLIEEIHRILPQHFEGHV
jgi:CheY-like chemotaxis protein